MTTTTSGVIGVISTTVFETIRSIHEMILTTTLNPSTMTTTRTEVMLETTMDIRRESGSADDYVFRDQRQQEEVQSAQAIRLEGTEDKELHRRLCHYMKILQEGVFQESDWQAGRTQSVDRPQMVK